MFNIQKLKKIIGNNVIDFKKLAIKMNVPHFKNRQFSQFLWQLCEKNIIATTKEKNYFVPQIEKEIQGIIEIHSKGFAFVKNNDYSIFVLPSKLNSAFNGDNVKVKFYKDPVSKEMYQGFVSEIIKRNVVTFVGTVKYFNKHLGLIPFNKNVKGIFRFKNSKGLQENDNVKVKIIEYKKPIIVEVIKKLDSNKKFSLDADIVIEDANIPHEFDFDKTSEAKTISENSDMDFSNREDLTEKLIITIDGEDSKDFDDAIDVEKLENGNYVLSVHIADVSNYIKDNTLLDNEAKLRGTSIYFPGKVVPMLPESLSNGICSLNPNVNRLTITVRMEIDENGEVKNYQLYKSVIKSKFKLTYQQVNKYYDENISLNNKELEKMLNTALKLSNILRKSKIKKGYIDFEIEESKIDLDENGNTKNIIPKERLKSENMIEDFMVLANETVAKFFDKNNLPIIYRIHHKPEKDQIENLQKVMNTLKIDIKISNDFVHSDFAKMVDQIKKIRFDNFIKIILLRTMPKAVYSSSNVGHFGLALEKYAHFTSPIRRYPDLIIHRILTEYFNNKNSNQLNHFKNILINLSKNCSELEQRAVDLERQVVNIKKAEFYMKHINKSFDGVIVSVQKFGFFVEFPNKTSGLVHILTLSKIKDKYKLLDNGHTISNGKNKFTIGDEVNVKIVGVSKSEGKIDLAISNNVNIT